MSKIYSIITTVALREKKRRVDFISIRKIKFYTKETLKLLNIALVALGFIIAIILIKYKPMYEVTILGQTIGYTKNKNALNEAIEENIENYKGKNIYNIELAEKPQYEFKLVEKTKEENESEIIIALQKEVEITYKYYEIALEDEIIEEVETLETAQQIVEFIEEETEGDIVLHINEKTTKNLEDINTQDIETAKNNIVDKLDINCIANVNGIKIATLPVTGTISSRYGASSRIRSSAHTGLDIAAPTGTPIQVVSDGVVISAQYTGSYGNLIKIQHENGVETWYAHTSKMYVKEGQKVSAGEVIGLVGSTGNSTGSHLHLEIRINGEHVDPQNYIYN